jgi:SNF family Na+-dependent transporter
MQTLGALLAVLAVGWSLDRSTALRELGDGAQPRWLRPLYLWLRFVVPGAILAVGIWWVATEVLKVTRAV